MASVLIRWPILISLVDHHETYLIVSLIETWLCFMLKDQYITSRADTMANIESTIVELGGIFQQLAHMVKEQEEMVDR